MKMPGNLSWLDDPDYNKIYKKAYGIDPPSALDADTAEDPIVPVAIREAVLQAAITAVTGDRNHSYGDPWDDFKRTANSLTAMGYGKRTPGLYDHVPLTPHDVAIIQIMVKLSRLAETPTKRDSWVDIAGYAGCGAEVAELE